jgi:hypothetical protein
LAATAGDPASQQLLEESLHLLVLARLLQRFALGRARKDHLKCDPDHSGDEGQGGAAESEDERPVPPRELAETVEDALRAREDRLVAEVPLDIRGERGG